MTSAKLYIYIGVGSRDLFIDEAHTVPGIFPEFFSCMLPTPLCGIYYMKKSKRCQEKQIISQFLELLEIPSEEVIIKFHVLSNILISITKELLKNLS